MKLGHFEIQEPVPELDQPHVLAVLRPWIDVGSVGTMCLSRMERFLQAKELGRLAQPGRFFDFTRYRPRSLFNQGRREYTVPNTIVRYAKRDEGPDLLLLHLLEPHLYGEDFVESVVELLQYFGVKRYTLMGGMYDMVPHTRPLLVSGLGTGPNVEEENGLLRVRASTYEGPTTIAFMVSQRADELGMETRTYVVHLPQYLQAEEDYTGTARLMEILCYLYHLPDRLIDRQRGQEQYRTLQENLKDNAEGASLLEKLEEWYDRERREEQPPPPPLPPNIEDFLRDVGDEGPSSTQG